MHRTILALALIGSLLGGCAPASEIQLDSPTTPPSQAGPASPTATVRPSATETPAPEPSNSPTLPPSPTPSQVPTVDPATMAELSRGYMTLVILECSIALLEETAQQVRDGALEGFEAFGSLVVLGALFQAGDEALASPPPADKLAPAWQKAGPALASARDILARWWDKEITSIQVLEEIRGPKAQIAEALKLADGVVSREYNVSQVKLEEWRAQASAEFRAIVHPTPTPAA